MSWPHALRWRLTLWYAATLALGLGLFAVGSFTLISRVLSMRADRFLRDARGGFLVELAVEAAEYPDDDDAVQMAVQEVRFEETRFVVYDGTGRVVASTAEHLPSGSVRTASTSENLAWDQAPTAQLDTASLRALFARYAVSDRRIDQLATIPTAATEYRVVIGGASVHGRPHTVLAVQDRSEHHATLLRLSIAYTLAIPLFLLAAVGGGYFMASRALNPVSIMARRARAISAATLHDRLPVGNMRDELGELAGVINELLARLEQAFAQQIRFVADASHELRTPVAILQAEAEIALGRDQRSEEEYREALTVVKGAGQRLANIVEDLFLLARVDAGDMKLRAEPLYLDELVSESIRAMRSVASRLGVSIEFESSIGDQGAPFDGAPALLDRLVLNLIDNAIKYSQRGAVVRVTLTRTSACYQLVVADDGVGIPADAQPHIFDRFYRADAARTRLAAASDSVSDLNGVAATSKGLTAASGAGLGLAIARWIAEAHGGSIELASSSSLGSEFLVSLPVQNPNLPLQ